MTFGGLVIANLFRNRFRTTLALLSLMVGFLLLVLLRSISAVFGGEADSFDTRLVVMAKYRSAYMLPMSHWSRCGGWIMWWLCHPWSSFWRSIANRETCSRRSRSFQPNTSTSITRYPSSRVCSSALGRCGMQR